MATKEPFTLDDERTSNSTETSASSDVAKTSFLNMNSDSASAEVTESIIADIVETAEHLLSQRFGGAQKLTDVRELGGSGGAVVLRARVAPSPFLQQRSVVLKHMPPTGLTFDQSTLMREIVAYQFTTSLSEDTRPGPVLLAHDVDKKLLVITDSGDGDTFADLLETRDEVLRVGILRNLGEAIGKMHASTFDKEQDFQILLKRILTKHPGGIPIYDFRERLLVASIKIGEHILRNAGFSINPIVSAFASDASRRLMSGHHRAFTPFDLSPDNIIVSDRTHFLDYEWAGFRDVTFDIACVIAGFPQFPFTRPISDDEADVFIDAWVQEVSQIWPNVNNSTRRSARIVTAMVGWAMSSLAMMHLGVDGDAFNELLDADFEVNAENAERIAESLTPITKQIFSDHHDNVSEECLTIREDLRETFEAMARFAARHEDARFADVAAFASDVTAHLTEAKR